MSTRRGSGLAAAYGTLTGLTITAALGWPYLLSFSLTAGSVIGWRMSSSPDKEKVASDA